MVSTSPDHRHFEVYLQLSRRRRIVLTKLQVLNEPGVLSPEWTEGSQCPIHTSSPLQAAPAIPRTLTTFDTNPRCANEEVSLLGHRVGSVADKRVNCGSFG